ncbi:unnamed protein product [Linum tenue]|uniref:Uncharacterized protein n=1 Tax=Linum tenue TaxID=586396 RepID=A0AAV0L9S2_9ROSI|nr:unnamed protein product [Linum tenue]
MSLIRLVAGIKNVAHLRMSDIRERWKKSHRWQGKLFTPAARDNRVREIYIVSQLWVGEFYELENAWARRDYWSDPSIEK